MALTLSPLRGDIRLKDHRAARTIVQSSRDLERELPALPRGEEGAPSFLQPSSRKLRPASQSSSFHPSPIKFQSQTVKSRTFASPPSKLSSLTDFAASTAFSNLLCFLPWSDFSTLTQTCSFFRNILCSARLRNIVLSRYVDGYGFCLRNSDERLVAGMKTVPVSLLDLDLLVVSQSTPLHIYPAHALSMLSSLLPAVSQRRKTQRLINLAQAHSRFVLLIQAIAHSSCQPAPVEPDPEMHVGVGPGSTVPTAGRTSGAETTFNGIRELKFPAPLSNNTSSTSSSQSSRSSADSIKDGVAWPQNQRQSSTPEGSVNHGRQSMSSGTSSSGHTAPAPSSFRAPQSSATGPGPNTGKRKNRVSMFGSVVNPLPPPSEPKVLKEHSWRSVNASSHQRKVSQRRGPRRAPEAWVSEDDSPFSNLDASEFSADEFTRPRPHFAAMAQKFSSSDSSLASASASYGTSGSGGTPVLNSNGSQSAAPSPSSSVFHSPRSRLSYHPAATQSPHELRLATSRVRAPILRVFVPCSSLSETPDGSGDSTGSIQQCEDQLVEVGLWEHLSIGDIVCNLGYVPPRPGAISAGDSDDEAEGHGIKRASIRAAESQKWLIFNGEILVPFCPTVDRVPHDDPLSLPSPFFYQHILSLSSPLSSSFFQRQRSAAMHPKLVLTRLPPSLVHNRREEPHMSLVNYPFKVQSPHSRGGLATVRKWVWIARFWVVNNSTGFDTTAMGVGWEGEWILEGEGTKEGKQTLLACLRGPGDQGNEWEFIREKSGGGRIWIKLLTAPRLNQNQGNLRQFLEHS
ncbi:hypothetical protein C8J56DRAFT_930845 [Mycena floridula]|nr:hypothetical protein C8J56DRAFT_930845 [Mycena floridula]